MFFLLILFQQITVRRVSSWLALESKILQIEILILRTGLHKDIHGMYILLTVFTMMCLGTSFIVETVSRKTVAPINFSVFRRC